MIKIVFAFFLGTALSVSQTQESNPLNQLLQSFIELDHIMHKVKTDQQTSSIQNLHVSVAASDQTKQRKLAAIQNYKLDVQNEAVTLAAQILADFRVQGLSDSTYLFNNTDNQGCQNLTAQPSGLGIFQWVSCLGAQQSQEAANNAQNLQVRVSKPNLFIIQNPLSDNALNLNLQNRSVRIESILDKVIERVAAERGLSANTTAFEKELAHLIFGRNTTTILSFSDVTDTQHEAVSWGGRMGDKIKNFGQKSFDNVKSLFLFELDATSQNEQQPI